MRSGATRNDTPHKVDGLVFEVELALLLKQSSNRKPGSNDVRTRFLGTPKGVRVSSSPLWWTKLDKIKNFRIEVQVSSVGVALTGLAAHPCGAPMRRAAGQSSQRGFYSEDLKSAMRLPAMS